MRDALGEQRVAVAEIPDLADTWERMGKADQLWKEDPTEKATRALVKPLKELTREVRDIRRVVTGEQRKTSRILRRRRRSTRLRELKRRLGLRRG